VSADARPSPRRVVELYDTTLRDGAQGTGFSYSIEDRLRILHKLDQTGVPFVEGGWPGANHRDTEFFRLATKEKLAHATLTAFGMTRKAGERASGSAVLRDLLDAGTEVVCLVGKSWDLHVTRALRTDLPEGVAMVHDSIAFLRAEGRRVFFDAEHFFDGYRSNPDFALAVLATAEEAGAERLVLCDTNGGMLPGDVAEVVDAVAPRVGVPLGIHVHNDTGCAVANSLTAVDHGVAHVQAVVNGYGERTGNADLIPIAANLTLKMGVDCLPDGAVERLTELSHYVAEVANVAPDARQPYAGRYAFTHKAGLHASGVARLTRAYEHVEPEVVGNRRGVVASDLGGAATLRMKAADLGVELPEDAIPPVLEELKRREARGYTFEVADASLELLMRRADGWTQPFFEVESYRVHVEERVGDDEPPLAEATVKVVTKGTRHIESAEGRGPVGALDNALRKALTNDYPELEHIVLEDFRVRVLDETAGGSGGSWSEHDRASGRPPGHGTGAVVRVLIDTSNGQREWTTVGVSENIIEASWEALVDGYLYGLLHPREDEEPEGP
jgi:2-isopropylmalate synthase